MAGNKGQVILEDLDMEDHPGEEILMIEEETGKDTTTVEEKTDTVVEVDGNVKLKDLYIIMKLR